MHGTYSGDRCPGCPRFDLWFSPSFRESHIARARASGKRRCVTKMDGREFTHILPAGCPAPCSDAERVAEGVDGMGTTWHSEDVG